MMRRFLEVLLMFACLPANAEILVPVRTIQAKEVIGAEDLVIKSGDVAGAVTDLDQVVGREARIALYAGRPVHPSDIQPPALIARNDLVTLVFTHGQLRIAAEGRSLSRAGEGDVVRAMNLVSRTTVTGRVLADGSIEVK
jgi:flagella basal body P-ring formation protein FlgA